jgi:hypothetical protein
MSTNGTRFNGEVITSGEAFEVGDGDIVSFGNTVIRFAEIPSPESSDTDTSGLKHNLINERRTALPKNLELDKITGMFNQSLNIDGMLEKLLEHVFDTLPRIDRAAILSFNNQKGQVEEVICRSRKENGNEIFRYNCGPSRSIRGYGHRADEFHSVCSYCNQHKSARRNVPEFVSRAFRGFPKGRSFTARQPEWFNRGCHRKLNNECKLNSFSQIENLVPEGTWRPQI